MSDAKQDILDIIDELADSPAIRNIDALKLSNIINEAGFIMLGGRLDTIVGLLQPESIAQWATRTNAPTLSRIERAAAELRISPNDLRHALQCAWNENQFSDQNYSNATEVEVDTGSHGIITPELP